MWQNSRSLLTRAGIAGIKLMCAIIVFLSFVFTMYAAGPALETKYYPVVSKLDIVSLRQLPNGRTEIRASFTKLRNCEYLGLAWYVGTRPENFSRVPVILLRDQQDSSSPNRPLGRQQAGPWIVSMPESELRGRSFAQLTHRCHPFWTTVTEFYP